MHRVLRAVGQHASHITLQTPASATGSLSWLVLCVGRAELLHARRFSDKPVKEGFLARLWGGYAIAVDEQLI